jgi:hypothetical protein
MSFRLARKWDSVAHKGYGARGPVSFLYPLPHRGRGAEHSEAGKGGCGETLTLSGRRGERLEGR